MMYNAYIFLYIKIGRNKMIAWVVFALAALFLICIRILFALEFYYIARDKGYMALRYFFMPFLFGKSGYMIIIALPDRNRNEDLLPH